MTALPCSRRGRIVTAARVACASAALLGASCSSAAKPTSSPATTAGTASSTTGVREPSTPPVTAGSGGADWLTYFHDASRSGVATGGPGSAPSAHHLWTSPALDGDVYAQPLVVGATVIEATENNTVYALDATTGAVRWSRHLGSPVPASSLPCGNVDPVGITSTPVIDAAAGRIYVAGLVQPVRDMLFALDLATGVVTASTQVDGPGADPRTHNQRGALNLSGGQVLVPFGGRYGDCGEYHGRLAAVPVPTGGAGFGTPRWYSLPTMGEGGFWAPPGPVVAGDGSILITSGNSSSTGPYDYGNTVVRLSPTLELADSFAPANWSALNDTDADLGSTNPALVGDRVFQAGKAGIGYLLAAGHLGGIGGQLAQGKVCSGQAMGGVSHEGLTLFVPCPDGIAAVSVAGDHVGVAWRFTASAPGPAILTPGALWTVATGSGDLVAIDAGDGHLLLSLPIGAVPSRFTSPAAGGGRVIVAADQKVLAFGD